jgi:hypothetical protein
MSTKALKVGQQETDNCLTTDCRTLEIDRYFEFLIFDTLILSILGGILFLFFYLKFQLFLKKENTSPNSKSQK